MYPDLFGIDNFSYVLMIVIGVITALVRLVLYLKKEKYATGTITDVLACAFFAIAIGIVGAILTQNLYNLIKDPENYKFSTSMTFYGGLIFGTIGFILIYAFVIRKRSNIRFESIAIVAPLCITSAHAFGRIGCFLAGCCYGKHTDSCIGIDFPNLGKRIPTQLIESIFLFILTAIFAVIVFKTAFKYTLHTYMVAYSIFRFIIEFFRGDEARGATFLGLYPSQLVCIFIWIIFVPTLIIFKKYIFVAKEKDDKE